MNSYLGEIERDDIMLEIVPLGSLLEPESLNCMRRTLHHARAKCRLQLGYSVSMSLAVANALP